MQLVGFSLRPLVSGSYLFAVPFGLTVDTCYVSLQRLLWEIAECSVFNAMLVSTVDLGDVFVEMFVFSAMLGSTLDTWCCQSMWPFHRCSSWTRLFALIQRCITVEVPQLQFLFKVVNIPVGAQRQLIVVSLFRGHWDSPVAVH